MVVISELTINKSTVDSSKPQIGGDRDSTRGQRTETVRHKPTEVDNFILHRIQIKDYEWSLTVDRSICIGVSKGPTVQTHLHHRGQTR